MSSSTTHKKYNGYSLVGFIWNDFLMFFFVFFLNNDETTNVNKYFTQIDIIQIHDLKKKLLEVEYKHCLTYSTILYLSPTNYHLKRF